MCASDPLHQLISIVTDHQTLRHAHPTDDFGWPLCQCEPCNARRDSMDAAFIDAILRGDGDPERGHDRNPAMEFDYDGDGGREHQDTMRASRSGFAAYVGTPPQPILPRVESPSIAPFEPIAEPAARVVRKVDET